MCYWRRLSKRSIGSDSDFEYTSNRTNLARKKREYEQHAEKPAISDSVNLFKALQVRHESRDPDKRAEARRLDQNSGWTAESVYGETPGLAGDGTTAASPTLVCYRYAEVLVFQLTAGGLLMVLICIALTCCWRLRKFSSIAFPPIASKAGLLNHHQHHHHSNSSSKYGQRLLSSGTPSPSLLIYHENHATRLP